MRVLHLTRDYPPRSSGGISTAVGGLVAALGRRDIATRVVSFDGYRPHAQSTEPAMLTGGVLRVSSPRHDEAIRALAAAWNPTVVHVHDALLWSFAERLAAPHTVYTVHVAQAAQREWLGLDEPTASELAERQALSNASVVTAATHACLVRSLRGVDIDRRGVVAAPGIDLGDGSSPQVRSPRQAPRHDGPLLFCGRFARTKGLGVLFDALERTLPKRPSLRLEIAGGLLHNRKAERRFVRRFRENRSADLVNATAWLGWLSPEELAGARQRASCVVAPSAIETYGLSVLEAMAGGVPVIASDVEGHRSQVTHGETGWLFPRGDARALSDTIESVLASPERAARVADNAAEVVRTRRTWDHVADQWLEAYR